jgi:hypothetical protein
MVEESKADLRIKVYKFLKDWHEPFVCKDLVDKLGIPHRKMVSVLHYFRNNNVIRVIAKKKVRYNHSVVNPVNLYQKTNVSCYATTWLENQL